MNFVEILNALDEIARCSGTNEKKDRLRVRLQDKNFSMVVRLALDPKLHFKMTKLPTPKDDLLSVAAQFNEREVFSCLKTFAAQAGVSNVEKYELAGAVNKVPGATEIINRIIKKDLRCGVKLAVVNSVHPDFIKVWPYMRCRSHSEKNLGNIKYPAIAQLKANGTHIDIVYDSSSRKLSFHSRVGNEYDFLGMLNDEAMKLFNDGKMSGVFIGEGVVLDNNGHILDRKTGNGVITKALEGTITREEISRIRIQLWEFVPYENFFDEDKGIHLEYEDSLDLVEMQTENLLQFSSIEYQMVENYEEVLSYYRDVKSRNLEGLVIKNTDGIFKSTNSGTPNQVKVKAVLGEEFEAEFRIVGINPGKEGTRFQYGIGSLQYVSQCGRIVGNVGSGMSHKERDCWTDQDVVGKIATIRFDEIIQDKRDDSVYSLYAPRLIELREKDIADTLEYVQELTEGK